MNDQSHDPSMAKEVSADLTPSGALRIVRDPAKWRDKWRAYKVVVDGAEVGKVRRGASVSVVVTAGAHRVQLRIDWCSSPELRIEIPSGAECVLECGPARSDLGNARQMTEEPSTYLWLREAQKPPIGAGTT